MPTLQPINPQNNSGKPFHFSHTKLSTFRRCLQQYHWKYVDGFFPPSSIGQTRGTAGHAALAVWHTVYDAKEALDAAWKAWETDMGTQGPEWDLLEASLGRYFEWSLTQKDSFKVLKAEQEFEIEFEVPSYLLYHGKGEEKYEQEHTTVTFTGFIDGIVEERGKRWLLENKFYKRMDNNPLDLDPQVSSYLLASNILGEDVMGVIYNIVRVADTKVAVTEPAVRRRLFRNPEGLSHIQHEMLLQVRRMINYHRGGEPYRNPTKDCHWDCPFYSACLLYTDDGLLPTNTLISLSQTRSTQNGEKETTQP